MSQPSDTTPEAERFLIEVYRKMPLARKWLLLGEMYRDGRILHATGFRQRHPGAAMADIHRDWLSTNLGFKPANLIRE